MKNFRILNNSLKQFKSNQLLFTQNKTHIILNLNITPNKIENPHLIHLYEWDNDKQLIINTPAKENIFKYCSLFEKRYIIYKSILDTNSQNWIDFIKTCINIEEIQLKLQLL